MISTLSVEYLFAHDSTDLNFFIKWLDDQEDLYDVLPARDVKPHSDMDVLDLMPGEQCQALFRNKLYVANGTF